MLRQARWLLYRDRVLEQLGALLLAYPRGRQFFADFPGLRAEMHGHFDAALPPASAALQLAAGVIAGLLRQLAPEEREDVAARLGGLDLDALKATARARLARRSAEAGEPRAFATELAALTIFMARGLAEEGTLGREEYDFLLAEIGTALCPAGADKERLSRRFALTEKRTSWGTPA